MGKIMVGRQCRMTLLDTFPLLSSLLLNLWCPRILRFLLLLPLCTLNSEHMKIHIPENPFYFLILNWSPILALLYAPHASAMEGRLEQGNLLSSDIRNLKKAIHFYFFFQKSKNHRTEQYVSYMGNRMSSFFSLAWENKQLIYVFFHISYSH